MAKEVEELPIGDLIPYINNAKTHPEKQIEMIASSIREFGFNAPILIDGENGIIAGHGRLEAAKKLNLESVPVVRLDHMSEAQKKAYILADNRLGEVGGTEWDLDLVSLELEGLKELDFDIDLTGFSLDDILVEPTEGLTDEDAVPEAPEEPVTVEGDIWVLGDHRVMCGDSTDKEQVERLMDGKIADFCFTSPPYSDMRDYGGGDMSVEKISSFIPASADVCGFYAVNLGLQRKDGSINPYWNEYINKANESELKLTSWNIWSKKDMGGSIANMTAMFLIEHEWIFVFGGDKESVNKTRENKTAGMKNSGTVRQKDGTTKKAKPCVSKHFSRMGTVFECDYARGEKDHPAAFPVELPEKYIEACSQIEGVIYEPFCGSGTTLIACEKTNRQCYGMELDPKYCDVIIQRWQDFTGKSAILERTGQSFNEIKEVKPELHVVNS